MSTATLAGDASTEATPASAGRFENTLANLPGTAAYGRRVKRAIVERASVHMDWFDRLPEDLLDHAARGRIADRVRDLLLDEAATFEWRAAAFSTLSPLLTMPVVIGGIFAGIALNIDEAWATLVFVGAVFSIIIGIKYAADLNYPVNAESEVLYWLLLSLRKEVEPRRDWLALHEKRALMRRIERIALEIEHTLPKQLISSDAATDAWMRSSARGMADRIRSWKLAVLTPNTESHAWLVNQLRQTLVSVAAGEWDRLHARDAAPTLRPRGLRRRTFDALLALVLGIGLPGLLLFAIQQLELLTDDPVFKNTVLGLLVWSAVLLNANYNPLFPKTVAAMKDVLGFLPFPIVGAKKE
jgi:hypothetical protein